MAKVMISMPDDLLVRIDAEAQAQGLSRSAMIRSYAETALGTRRQSLAQRIREFDDYVAPHSGDVVAELTAAREGRYR